MRVKCHCEDALEILHELVDADVSLHMWFARGLDFGQESLVDAQLKKTCYPKPVRINIMF